MELEDVCDEQDAQAKKRYHEAQLKQYRMRKHVELELVKGEISSLLLYCSINLAIFECTFHPRLSMP